MWGSFWILWNLWMSTAYFENYWVNCETNNFSYLSILLENKILISGIQMSMDIIEKSCWICSSGSKFEKRVTLDFVIFITIFVRFQRNQRVIQVETRYISSTSPKALKCMLHTFIFVNGDIIFPKNGFDSSIVATRVVYNWEAILPFSSGNLRPALVNHKCCHMTQSCVNLRTFESACCNAKN